MSGIQKYGAVVRQHSVQAVAVLLIYAIIAPFCTNAFFLAYDLFNSYTVDDPSFGLKQSYYFYLRIGYIYVGGIAICTGVLIGTYVWFRGNLPVWIAVSAPLIFCALSAVVFHLDLLNINPANGFLVVERTLASFNAGNYSLAGIGIVAFSLFVSWLVAVYAVRRLGRDSPVD